jgi:hypothetical protein
MSATGAGQDDLSAPSLDATRAALLGNGIEVFRVKDGAIQLAQRVRSHLMDAGVSVNCGAHANVLFTVRAQNSDFPGTSAEEMFGKVRKEIATRAQAQGFAESDSRCRQIQDPVDALHILDVWYELTFSKPTQDLTQLLADVRWALDVSKCI